MPSDATWDKIADEMKKYLKEWADRLERVAVSGVDEGYPLCGPNQSRDAAARLVYRSLYQSLFTGLDTAD